ncbi:MAG: GntR family transcriptional regulator [Caldilineaceae bacterium]|nr:GntR family transcriptional regulator [Caldilineaceae bacterium]
MASNMVHGSKKEFVYESLREEILEGHLPPGQRVIIDDLAERLGVSPIPVREALQQLQHDGFVTIEPFVGAHVTEIHAGLIREVFALLEASEIVSSQSACLVMSEKELAELEALIRRMDGNVDDLEAWSDDNVRLHGMICEVAGMTLVASVMKQVLDHWKRLRRHYLEEVSGARVKHAQREHWQMLAALRTRDPGVVADVIRQHNRLALDAYLDYLTKSGQLVAPESYVEE